MTTGIVFSALAAAIASVACVVLLRPVAFRVGLVDFPDERKQHRGRIPQVGGVALFLSFFFTYGMNHVGQAYLGAYFLAALTVLVVGLLDDYFGLRASTRLLAQAMAGLIMIFYGDLQLENLGNLFGLGAVHTGVFAIPFTIFCIVGVINALNMLDGLDGLAGSVGLVSAIGLAIAASISGGHALSSALLIFLAALAGFLVFNIGHRWRAERFRVFLGDSGSMLLGFTLVWATVEVTQSRWAIMPPIVAVWLLGLPVMDTVCVMIRRLAQKKNPFSADRQHLHHLLLAYGNSEGKTVKLMVMIAVVLSGTGLVAWQTGVPSSFLTAGFLILSAGYLITVDRAWERASSWLALEKLPANDPKAVTTRRNEADVA